MIPTSRPSIKKKFSTSPQDLATCLDQKNSMISLLQNEVINLRPNQEIYHRLQQTLAYSKDKYESLIRQNDTLQINNQERLEIVAKSVQELKGHAELLEKEFQVQTQTLKQAKAEGQELTEHNLIRQDQINELQYRAEELIEASQFLKMDGERTFSQMSLARQENQKQKQQVQNINKSIQNLKDKCYKVQAFNRNLVRQEENISQNLKRLEEENNYFDQKLQELEVVCQLKVKQFAQLESNIQENSFRLAQKQLQLKKLEKQNKEVNKNLNCEKAKVKPFVEQLQQKKLITSRLEAEIRDCSEEMNYIMSKNREVIDVNGHLKNDLKVCQRHLQNVLRVNKAIEVELTKIKEVNQAAIKKLQEPFRESGNLLTGLDMNKISFTANQWAKNTRLSSTGGSFENSL